MGQVEKRKKLKERISRISRAFEVFIDLNIDVDTMKFFLKSSKAAVGVLQVSGKDSDFEMAKVILEDNISSLLGLIIQIGQVNEDEKLTNEFLDIHKECDDVKISQILDFADSIKVKG